MLFKLSVYKIQAILKPLKSVTYDMPLQALMLNENFVYLFYYLMI